MEFWDSDSKGQRSWAQRLFAFCGSAAAGDVSMAVDEGSVKGFPATAGSGMHCLLKF